MSHITPGGLILKIDPFPWTGTLVVLPVEGLSCCYSAGVPLSDLNLGRHNSRGHSRLAGRLEGRRDGCRDGHRDSRIYARCDAVETGVSTTVAMAVSMAVQTAVQMVYDYERRLRLLLQWYDCLFVRYDSR